MNRTYIVGRLVLTTCVQGSGAPVIDGARVEAADGRSAGGVAIRRKPTIGRALVVAVIGRRGPLPYRWRYVPARLTRPRGHLA